MNIGTEILFALFSLAIAAATFFIGRTSAAKQEGASLATMKTDISYIKESLKDIKDSLKNNDNEHRESVRRLHERINNHLRLDHGMNIPPTE